MCIEMILMTKSSKYGEYCIAGFECGSGRWIRLVSDNEQTHGALSDEMLYDPDKGRCADVLDRVRVEIERACPGRVQTENVLVSGAERIRILEKVTLEEVLSLHPCEMRNALFDSHYHIVQADVETLGHSLEFIWAENVRIYTVTGSGGKPKYKVDFECGAHRYTQFAMTDPDYYDRKEHRIDHAVLVLSISDDEWSQANGHYIYAAKIFDLAGRRQENGKRGKMAWKQIAAAVLLTALTALGAVLAHMPKAYVPPYSGSRYHLSETCERMQNPSAVYRLPMPLAKLFCAPCGVCAADVS